MATFRTKAVVLQLGPWGENGQLVTLYTQSHGKVQAQVRGAKKIISKLSGSLQFFCIVDVMVAHGKVFDHLAGAQILECFTAIATDYRRRLQACFGLELLDRLTSMAERDTELFLLLAQYLEFINANSLSPRSWQLVKDRFTSRILSQLGYQPPVNVKSSDQLHRFLYNHLQRELNTERLLAVD